jgi:hypothetical protein
MADRTETITTINLDHDQMLVFNGGRDGRIRVLHGAAWLTEEGQSRDVIVRAGGEVAVHGGRALIASVGSTRVQITEQIERTAMRQAVWLRQAWRSVRQHIVRLQLGPATA